MKRLKRVIAVVSLIMAMTLFTGCSVGETWDLLWGHNNADETATSGMTFDPNAVKVDESVSAPVFTKNLEGSRTYAIGDPAEELQVEAAQEAEGVITYQWYVNTVDSNGGGEKIIGATAEAYAPDTQKEGRFYYFVVATHTIDKKINLSTSAIAEIIIDPNQEPAEAVAAEEPQKGWVETDKGWYYYGEDGQPIKNKSSVEIEGKIYNFNEEGLMRTGWYEGKKDWYYLGKDGAMIAESFIEDGGKRYYLDGKGRMKRDAWVEGDKGKWYYAQDNGSLAVGWTELKGDWYYFNPDGVMRYDVEIDGKWLNPDGRLAH